MVTKANNYVPVIEFYDLIAEEYNLLLNQNPQDVFIRNYLKNIFLQTVKAGPVIDFGGGTGLDLPWLCENGFKIYFCEPSEKMRLQAKKLNGEKLNCNKIVFLENGETDFHVWAEKNPFPEKANAILANFSVLNCIPDIKELFLSFSKVICQEGYVFVTMLDTTFLGRMKYLLRKPSPDYQNKKHFIYRHSIKKIRNSTDKYFSILDIIPLRQRGLMLIKLQRTNAET
jgi:hypothetical protein